MGLELLARVDVAGELAPHLELACALRIIFGLQACGTWQSEQMARTPVRFV